jgi:hypothetical protein
VRRNTFSVYLEISQEFRHAALTERQYQKCSICGQSPPFEVNAIMSTVPYFTRRPLDPLGNRGRELKLANTRPRLNGAQDHFRTKYLRNFDYNL